MKIERFQYTIFTSMLLNLETTIIRKYMQNELVDFKSRHHGIYVIFGYNSGCVKKICSHKHSRCNHNVHNTTLKYVYNTGIVLYDNQYFHIIIYFVFFFAKFSHYRFITIIHILFFTADQRELPEIISWNFSK